MTQLRDETHETYIGCELRDNRRRVRTSAIFPQRIIVNTFGDDVTLRLIIIIDSIELTKSKPA